jgi:hypothetical protein
LHFLVPFIAHFDGAKLFSRLTDRKTEIARGAGPEKHFSVFYRFILGVCCSVALVGYLHGAPGPSPKIFSFPNLKLSFRPGRRINEIEGKRWRGFWNCQRSYDRRWSEVRYRSGKESLFSGLVLLSINKMTYLICSLRGKICYAWH